MANTRFRFPALLAAIAAAALAAQAAPAWARQPHRWHGSIVEFEAHNGPVWRGGSWHHGHHHGHYGWWWVVGGLWYFYPRPVYPYPDPYTPPVVVIERQASPPEPAPAQVPTQVWYYCDAARAYYPYVATCPSGWRTVPATPPQ